MASSASHSLITLRVITQRLTATPTRQLPHVVPYLASDILSCQKLLQNIPSNGSAKDGSEAAVVAHKFKTQISTLLLGKSPQAKWAAVVLIKATVEVGGWEVLRTSGGWVRGLIGILLRPDPEVTKELCIITLTRIFLLTEDHHSLIREITTPTLPTFIASCLNILKARPSAAERRKPCGHRSLPLTVIQALCELLPNHPTLFRPFVAETHLLVMPLIAPTQTSLGGPREGNLCATTASISEHSRKLFVLLNFSASHKNSGEEWTKSLLAVISSLHRTADLVFRAIIEDWEPSSTRLPSDVNTVKVFSETVNDMEQDHLGLPGWRGIHAGMERLDGILQTMQIFLTTATPSPVNLPIGTILDAVTRALSVIPPSVESGNRFAIGLRVNTEIGRNERESLFTALPRVHISALGVLSTLISRLGYNSAALCHGTLTQVLWVFENEIASPDIRRTTYELSAKILASVGLSLPKSLAPLISRCVKKCCEDLLSQTGSSLSGAFSPTEPSQKLFARGTPLMNADLYFNSSMTRPRSLNLINEVQISAAKLLPFTLTHVPRGFFSQNLRAQIDRTAILTQNKEAMFAAVLNPLLKRRSPREISSIMPILARQFPNSLEVEALIRPRMPVLQPRTDEGDARSDVDDEEIRENDSSRWREDNVEDLNSQAGVRVEGHFLSPKQVNPLTKSVELGPHNPLVAEILSTEIPTPTSRGLGNKRPAPSMNLYDDNSISQNVAKESSSFENASLLLPDADLGPNKRARLEANNTDTVDRTAGYLDTFASEDSEGKSAAVGQPFLYTSTVTAEEEIDSDDGEIPRIDTGIDTDEDEDVDADEGDEK